MEDEILKVAVMKYGQNQWARISSLLVRKTPKMCKARWNEWLDPSIRKTEWSKEEEEKLLHLAKVMPTQWRTIAPMIGRTAAQCLEHYEALLDRTRKDEDEEEAGEGMTISEAKRLRPGEIDPSPETKPARPDPVDMDEDEKEMLSEARARLANTQGKKAKRKARERLLDDARRVAALQKRREMQAAGLVGPAGLKIRGLNYNVEVPFERAPVPGFHDATRELADEEHAAKEAKAAPPKKRSYTPTREALELAARRKDAQREQSRVAAGFLPSALEKRMLEQQLERRQPLQLPSPQITEADLEQIVKTGKSNEATQMAALEGETPASSTLRPLPSATPLRSYRLGTGMATPSANTPATAKASPYRDQLNIQGASRFEEPMDPTFLRSRLRALPKPKNDFEIVAPELEED